MSAEVLMNVDSHEKPTLSINLQLDLTTNDISLNFHGGISAEILKLLTPIIKTIVVNGVHKNMATIIANINTQVNQILANFPSDIEIQDPFWITYSLPYAPNCKNDFISVGLNSYIYLKNKKNPPPFNPPVIPLRNDSNPKDVHFILSDFLLNTGILAAYNDGLLKV